jgi:hypothetical protein
MTVHTHIGYLTKGGAPQGACPASSAAGALQAATRGRWSGSWSTSFNDYFITTILGDTESGKRSYWELLVNNVAASKGACGISLHTGDQLLFAAVSIKGTAFPLAVKLLSRPLAGKPFEVQVVYYDATGAAKPLAGARVTAAVSGSHRTISARTDASGVATLTESRLGLIELMASKRGFIRAAPAPAQVQQHGL